MRCTLTSNLKSWLNLGPEDVLRLRKAVYGFINAPPRWRQRLSRALRPAGFASLQMDPCVWILQALGPVKSVSSVDVATKARTAVADREMFKECCECVLMIWLVVDTSLFRKLRSCFGLS